MRLNTRLSADFILSIQKIRDFAAMQRTLLANASFITIGAVTSAVLGFLFWTVAARHLPPETIGLASATVSAMALVATLAEIGLGTLLVGEGLKNRRDGARLVSAALLTAVVLTVVCGTIWLSIIQISDLKLSVVLATSAASLLFLVGAAGGTLTSVIDDVLTGRLDSLLRMYRECVFSAAKLALLPAVLGLLASRDAVTVLLAWVLASMFSIIFVAAAVMWWRGGRILHAPDFPNLLLLLPKSLKHHGLNLVASLPTIVLPLLVTEIVSPEANAVFFMAMMILQVLLLVPASLSTALYAVGSTSPNALAAKLRFALVVSTVCTAIEILGFIALLNVVLSLLNPSFPDIAGWSLKYLGLGMLPRSIKFFYIAVMRLQNRMAHGSALMAVCGMTEIGGAAIGGLLAGLPGLVAGWLIASVLEMAILTPTVVAAWRGSGNPDLPEPARSQLLPI